MCFSQVCRFCEKSCSRNCSFIFIVCVLNCDTCSQKLNLYSDQQLFCCRNRQYLQRHNLLLLSPEFDGWNCHRIFSTLLVEYSSLNMAVMQLL